ncbi:hypothetical protein GLOTRDRAFT_55479 [Gloeophyllum trabeum ATCC 11539]|uniref:VTT domain-containing protein n=1 Tax=Gloeophyllum trabeum (strain ATCC 11539 / FP-39264 / Madison 617) TaxID=670483 RepID=S7QJC1_GLOTA|nr:uncharacterized protein GLOTRDRAFT_55479 [Gloeophyllum trabeum ATCC 11539]EPQ59462.1 hypothetical protein GLOTRDRAFT_55479 [Gloeophyllum trabeum ATCC 11539]
MLAMPPPEPTPPSEPNADPLNPLPSADASPSLLAVLASKLLQLVPHYYKHSHHPMLEVEPPSPGSSADDPILPLSSSPSRASFGDVFNEQGSPLRDGLSRPWWSGVSSVHAPLLLVITLFPLSTALVLYCFWTLPVSGSWPRTLADLTQMGRELHEYSQSGSGPMAHVIGVLSITAVWNHAWSIPGSVLWNVLAGALFSPVFATLLLTSLTTLGSIAASLLSMPLAPILTRIFPRALDLTRSVLEGSSSSSPSNASSSAWVRLSIMRLVGIIPWSGINIACGLAGVPLLQCLLGSFIGGLPWTAVTCQLGDILQSMAVGDNVGVGVGEMLARPEMIARLVFLTVLAGAPVLGKEKLKAMITPSEDAMTERGRRWAWVKEWRARLRSRSPEGQRKQMMKELTILVDEKRAREDQEGWA